jgi:hypothetical protein
VTIVDIVPRCGPSHNLPCDATVNPYFLSGDVASFGVVIQNLSPTGE